MPDDVDNNFSQDGAPAPETISDGATDPTKISKPWKVGDKDPLGDTITKIFIRTDRFVIYTAVTGPSDNERLGYILPDDYDTAKGLRLKLAPIVDDLAFVKDVIAGLRATKFLPTPNRQCETLRDRTLDLMARAMQQAFDDDKESPVVLLDHAKQQAAERRDSRNRMRYIFANVVALGLILAAWFLVRDTAQPYNNPVVALLERTAFGVRFGDVLALGAMGAFFSVSATIGKIGVNYSISVSEMLYAGFVRVFIGVIAAGVVILLMRGGWILGAIDPQFKPWALYVFGFLAGFSESFVANALRKVENSTDVQPPAR